VGTLDQMAGNDIDQASLLISLLRYKGIPARYVRGTIEIPVEVLRYFVWVNDM
jgi:transglutaminase-like putative cysteine protease